MNTKKTKAELVEELNAAHQRIAELERLSVQVEKITFDQNGTPISALGVTQDLTDRKRAEDELHFAERRYRALIENAPDGIVLIGTDFKFKYASPSAARIFGYDLNVDLELSPDTLTHPDDLPMVVGVLSDLLEHPERTPTIQYRFLHKDGNWRWIESTFSNLLALPSVEALVINFRDITESKQMESEHAQLIERLNLAASSAHIGIWDWNIQKNQLVWDDQMYALYGLKPEEFGGAYEAWLNGIHPEDREASDRISAQALRGEQIYDTEFRVVWPDGSIHWIKANGDIFRDENGAPLRMVGINYDITERKRSEMALQASEANYRKLAETSDSAIAVLDRDGRILYVNPVSLHVWEEPQLVGKTIHDLFPEKIADGYLAVMRRVIDQQSTDTNELEVIIKERRMWFHVTLSPLKNSDGTADTLLLNAMDITERKLVEDSLRHSELKYRSLYENLRDCFVGVTFDGVILEYNDAYRNMLGYSDAELRKMTFMDVTPEKWHTFEDEIIKTQVLTRGYSDVYEKEYRNKDGVIFPVEVRAQMTWDEAGRPSGMWAVVRDITYRKVIEQELIRINERFTELAEHVSDIFWISEPQTFTNLYISPAFTTIMGRSKEDVAHLPNGYLDVVLPEDQPILIHKRELESSGFKTDVQYRIRRPDESIRWIRDKGTPVFNSEGRVIRVVGSASDITEQVEAAMRISESEKRFQQIAETIPEMFWMFDNVRQNLIYVSPAYELIWGRPVQELYGNNDSYLESIVPEDRNVVFEALQQQANGEESEMEYRVVQPNGSIRWVHDRSFPIFDEKSGALIRTTGIVTDITERKQTETALRESETRLRLSISAGKQGLYDLDLRTGEAIVNREYAEMLGYDPETFAETNQAWIERTHPDDVKTTTKVFDEYIHGLIPEYQVEFRQRTRDGKWKWILSLGRIVEYDADGKPTRMIGTHTDITEQKQAELDLKKRASHLALINDVGRQITSFLNFQAVMDIFPRIVQEAFGYHHIGLFTLDKNSNQLLMVSKAGEYARLFPQGHSIPLGEGVVGSVALSGEMKLANRVYDDPLYLPTIIPTQSELSLPIKIGDEVVGVLDVQSPETDAFTDEDIQVLRTLVDQMAIVIENARLYEAAQKELAERKRVEEDRLKLIHDLGERVKEMTVLHQSAHLFQTSDFSEAETMQTLVDNLPSAWRYQEITVARIRLGEQEYRSAGFTETSWMQKVTFSLPNQREGSIEVAYLEERPEADEGPFLNEEYQILQTLAQMLQAALIRQSIEHDLRKRTEDLSNLLEAGRALSETLDPERIYPLVYQYISAAMPCDFLVMSSFDPQTELITCEYLHSVEGSQDISGFPRIPLEPPGQGTQSLAIRSGQSLLLPDYDKAVNTAATKVHFNEKAEIVELIPDNEERTRSAIIVPLKVNGVVAGALQVLSSRLHAHTPNHLQFVEALAFHVSAALSNAKLFSELEQRVQQRTAEVRDLYENAPTGYHSLNAEGRLVNINQTELNWLGYTREEMIGRAFTDFITPETVHVFFEFFPIFKQRGWINNLELDLLRKDGTSFPALINATAAKNEAGELLVSRSTVFDITERKQAELALREREEVYRALFQSANDAIFMLSPDGVILRANPRCFDLVGFTADKLVGRRSDEFIAHSEQDDADSLLTRLLAGERLPVYERHFMRKDGSLVNTEVNLSLIRDESGEPKFIQSVVRDISARKHAENALRESEEQNRLLFEDSPDAVVLFDQLGRVVRINHAFETITGRQGDQFIGHLLTDLGILPRQLIEALSVSAQDALEQDGKIAVLEFKMEHTSGEVRDISARIFTLNLHGEPHYLASIHDITTSKRAEETLRLANNEMERALRLKDEFLANMSHELRTPLNAVLGITESLLEQVSGPLNEKQLKYLQTVSESAQHLLELINDILDLAKINAGRIDLEINKSDIVSVSHASLRMVRELAHKKGVATDLKIDTSIKLAWVDERRLKQMLVNLLSNAVKFTPKDGSIGLEVHGDEAAGILYFTVWDTGIGISQQDLRLLFQPFVQLDAGLARGNQGTGLGLVLVSQMARLHGGSVSVESEPGKGSRFTISLPWLTAGGTGKLVRQEHPLITKDSSSIRPKDETSTILIVDDTEAVTMLISDYLIQHGYQVIIAHDGYEGIARSAETRPDLILMDVMMPELDGFETTRRLRNKPDLADIPIIALTALAMAGDRERCIAAGMNDYLSKPVKLKELLDTIEHHLAARSGGSK
ncbi:MAG: PAS domain S-box protein [Anaerolineae bacterium]|nr:PAS domain S-box protein [Anaerolineae bacterium]